MAMFLCARILNWAWGAVMAMFLSNMAWGQEASMPAIPVATKPDAEILRAAEAYRSAVLGANAAGVAALFREDAVEMPPFQPPITGRVAIERFYQGMFKGRVRVTGFTFTHTETTTHGDVAYDVGTYKRTMSGAPTGLIEAVGRYVAILKRTGGEWKVAYIIYNCDCPPPPAGSHRDPLRALGPRPCWFDQNENAAGFASSIPTQCPAGAVLDGPQPGFGPVVGLDDSSLGSNCGNRAGDYIHDLVVWWNGDTTPPISPYATYFTAFAAAG